MLHTDVIAAQSLLENSVNTHDEFIKKDFYFSGYSTTELRNLDSARVKRLQRFYCNDIGKVGYFNYDSADSVTVDDGGYCIITKDGLRLKRNVMDRVLYTWFEDSVDPTDQTDILNKALKISNFLQKPLYLKKNSTIIVDKSVPIFQSLIGINSTIKLKDNCQIPYKRPILEIKNNNVKLEGFTLDGNRINNIGLFDRGVNGIYANKCKNLTIRNIKVINTRDIGLYVTNCPNFQFFDSVIDGCGRFGQQMLKAQRDRIGCLVDNSVSNDNEYFMGRESTIDGVSITNSGLDGLVLGVGLKLINSNLSFNGKEFSDNDVGAGGVYVRPPQQLENAVLDGLSIVNCTAIGNTGIGIDIGNNEGSLLNPKVTNLIVSKNTCHDNYLNGIGVASVENFEIRKNICFNNGVRALLNNNKPNKRRSGILIACIRNIAFKNGTVENNICYDTRVEKTQQYGLMFWGLTKKFGSENIVIKNNDFTRNAENAIYFEPDSPVISNSLVTIQNNKGDVSFTFVPQNGLNLPPVASVIYLNPYSAINCIGIEESIIKSKITLVNISGYYITLINSDRFKLRGNGNYILKQNNRITFILKKMNGNLVWVEVSK